MLAEVRIGSWLCENASTLDVDRRSYSFRTVLAVKLASAFNLENELKNVILAVFRSFAFSHSQGHLQTCPAQDGVSASPLKADNRARGQHARYGPTAVVSVPEVALSTGHELINLISEASASDDIVGRLL
jgi:hypothetical protein